MLHNIGKALKGRIFSDFILRYIMKDVEEEQFQERIVVETMKSIL